MTKEAENLQTALALKQRSEAARREALLAGARGSADDRQHKLGHSWLGDAEEFCKQFGPV